MSNYITPRSSFAMRVAACLLLAVLAACFAGQTTAMAQDSGSTLKAAYTVKTLPKYGDDAVNTTGTANTRLVYCYGPIDGVIHTAREAVVTNLDVTNDGWADKIKVTTQRASSTSGLLRKVKITINGKKVLSYVNSSDRISRVAVSVKTLKNKQEFLWVDITDGRGVAKVQKLYRCNGKKLKTVFSNKALAKKRTSNQFFLAITPKGNNIYITSNLTTTVTGNTRVKYAYTYKNGTMVRTSNTITDFSYASKSDGTYTKNKLTAAGKFNAYTSKSLKKKAFTVKPGTKVQPVAMYLKGKKMLYKLRVGSKYGWISCPKIKRESSKSPSTLFYETYGKVKLKASIPAYTTTRLYSATALQKYNDHALFIARNEIYARNGRLFKTPELDMRFRHSYWWSYHRTALNYVESANAALMYSIEKNRRSQYLGV